MGKDTDDRIADAGYAWKTTWKQDMQRATPSSTSRCVGDRLAGVGWQPLHTLGSHRVDA